LRRLGPWLPESARRLHPAAGAEDLPPQQIRRPAVQFIDDVLAKLAFETECVQTDNGAEFQGTFHWHLLDRGIQRV
jgi:hypothetical protein